MSVSLDGAHIVITGAASGIGYATAAAFLRTKARVTLVTRDERQALDTVRSLRRTVGEDADIAHETCDLSLLRATQALAERLAARGPIDGLVSNAGVQPFVPTLTDEGLELTLATNVLAHFMLVEGLAGPIAVSRLKWVIATGSMVHRWGRIDWDDLENAGPFRSQAVYARSKAELMLLQTAFAARLGDRGIAIHTLEPGMTKTRFARHFAGFDRVMAVLWRPFIRDPADVAAEIVALARRDDLHSTTIRYWHRGRAARLAAAVTDTAAAERLWRFCADTRARILDGRPSSPPPAAAVSTAPPARS